MPFAKSGGIKPKPCKNNCGANIYFDANSAVGKTADGRWVPLLWNDDQDTGTDEPHQCPNSRYAQQQRQQQEEIPGLSKGPIPASGPRDWEEKLGLLNGQIFTRLDRIDKSIMEITQSLAKFAKYLESNQRMADSDARYDQDKEEDGFA
jgi:hypothetical protein